MASATPRLRAVSDSSGQRWLPEGPWTASALAQPAARALLRAPAPRNDGAWDLRAIERLDHTGAQLLWNWWQRRWPAECEATPAQRAMLERVARFSTAVPSRQRAGVGARWNALGRWVWRVLGHGLGLVRMVGQLALDALHLLREPWRGPWRDFSGHLFHIGATALPITALVGFLIGVVLAYLIAQQLRLFGADPYIVNILGLSIIRELGPVLAAILLAGRSGSTITAQIGVMRVTEELDAMRVLGIARGYRLVLPRVMALALAMPLVSVWTTVAALTGGMLAAYQTLGVTPDYFVQALPDAVRVSNLVLATAKSVVFGVFIAIVACHFGLRIQPDTDSLGRGTTASVVVSITCVILVNAVFAVVFRDVGV